MTRHAKKILLLAEIESTYGVDASPTTNDAMLIMSPSITPIAGDTISRELVRPYFGALPTQLTNKRVEISFAIDYAASGEAGTAPAYAKILRACGLAQTATTTQVTYTPVSAEFESVTLYYYLDGALHAVTGTRGTFSLTYEAGANPLLNFTLTGMYNRPTTRTLPSASYPAFKDPLIAGTPNMAAFSVVGVASTAACPSKIEFDLGTTIGNYNTLCDSSAIISAREATIKTTITAPVLATKNYYQAVETGDNNPFVLTHGVSAGQKITLHAPKAQLSELGHGENENVLQYELSLKLLPNAGNDEFYLRYE